MEIILERLVTFTPEIMQTINNLLMQLNPDSKILSQEYAKDMIEGDSNRIFVARESVGNKIVGMLTLIIFCAPSAKKGQLEDVVVDENYRGKGIGEKLIIAAINQAREENVKRLDLTSNPKRVAANSLYQRLGFKIRDTNVYRMEL